METLTELVLTPDEMRAQWMELIMRNGNKTAPEQITSPFWVHPWHMTFITEAPLSNLMHIEIPAINDQLKTLTQCSNEILSGLMTSTNTLIRIKLPLTEEANPRLFICGGEDDIHVAKRELVNYMPIDIVFDIDRDYMDTSKIVSIAYNNSLGLAGAYRSRSVLRVTLRGEEGNVETMYRVHQEIREMQAKCESKEDYLRLIRYSLELNSRGLFDDMDLESTVPTEEGEETTVHPLDNRPVIMRESSPIPPQEELRFIRMPTSEAYEEVLNDDDWWIMPRHKLTFEESNERDELAAARGMYIIDTFSSYNLGTSF